MVEKRKMFFDSIVPNQVLTANDVLLLMHRYQEQLGMANQAFADYIGISPQLLSMIYGMRRDPVNRLVLEALSNEIYQLQYNRVFFYEDTR